MKLLETKPLLEVALAEHERVKVAMEGVARELEREAAERAKLAPATAGLSIASGSELGVPSAPAASLSIPAADAASTAAPGEKAGGGADSPPREHDPPVDEVPEVLPAAAAVEVAAAETESVGVSTDPVATEEAAAQTDSSGPPPPPGLDPRTVSEAVAMAATLASQEKEKAAREAEERGIATGRAEATAGLSKVLRLLHVASRFEAKGKRLPTAVDFFSKVSEHLLCSWRDFARGLFDGTFCFVFLPGRAFERGGLVRPLSPFFPGYQGAPGIAQARPRTIKGGKHLCTWLGRAPCA